MRQRIERRKKGRGRLHPRVVVQYDRLPRLLGYSPGPQPTLRITPVPVEVGLLRTIEKNQRLTVPGQTPVECSTTSNSPLYQRPRSRALVGPISIYCKSIPEMLDSGNACSQLVNVCVNCRYLLIRRSVLTWQMRDYIDEMFKVLSWLGRAFASRR